MLKSKPSPPLNKMGNLFSSYANSPSSAEASAALLAAFDGMALTPRPLGQPSPTSHSRAKVSQLLRANHLFYATLYNDRRFHNHTPHILISAYFLGATPSTLYKIYENATEDLAKWEEDSPAEVTDEDWHEFTGDKQYERGFQDFFQEKVTDSLSFDWRNVVREFLVTPDGPDNPKVMVQGMLAGLLHPLIHLGYAVEFDDWEVATEALTLCAVSKENESFQLLDLTPFDEQATTTTHKSSALDILKEIRNDPSYNGLYEHPSEGKIGDLVSQFPKQLSKYINQFSVGKTHEDLIANLKELLVASALILTCTHKDDKTSLPAYDFFLLHLLTATHAAIEIFENPPANGVQHAPLLTTELEHEVVQKLWVSFVVLYIIQMRPSIEIARITSPANANVVPSLTEGRFSKLRDPNDMAWANIDAFLFPPNATKFDSHVIKAVRALLFAGRYLDKSAYGLPETTEAGLELFTQAAFILALSMENQSLIGFTESPVTLDIKR